jgi:hypothetical protein
MCSVAAKVRPQLPFRAVCRDAPRNVICAWPDQHDVSGIVNRLSDPAAWLDRIAPGSRRPWTPRLDSSKSMSRCSASRGV